MRGALFVVPRWRAFSTAPVAFPLEPLTGLVDMSGFTNDKIRSFSITAHIDHGKSTLSTSLLPSKINLDSLEVERERNEAHVWCIRELWDPVATVLEFGSLYDDDLRRLYSWFLLLTSLRYRGITVHSSTASWIHDGVLMNLIDTPGHVDFRFEVSRAFLASEGALLLVDASQGVQAQTIANFWTAFENDSFIIPVVNKIDLATANVEDTVQQMVDVFGIDPTEVIPVSAKSQRGVDQILPAVLERVPAPKGDRDGELQLMVAESYYDRHHGVILVTRIFEGQIHPGDMVTSKHSGLSYKVQEIGILTGNERLPAEGLYAGQVGYMTCGMRSALEAVSGDTFVAKDSETPALPGFEIPAPVVFSGIYSASQEDTQVFVEAMEKYKLKDSSLSMHKETNTALGTGYRCGFHGVLHLEVFVERLKQEHDIECVATVPSVPYRLNGDTIIETPEEFPELVPELVEEPYVESIIVVPQQYVGKVMELCHERRGSMNRMDYLGTNSALAVLTFEIPSAETVSGFVEKLKELTSGYASYEYKPIDYRKGDIVKVCILLNGVEATPLSFLVHKAKARTAGLEITARLKKVIRRHMFEVIIQAAIGKKILCRERIAPFRKDVTAKLYGGDVTRRMKLLNKQKKGKKKMRNIGNVELSPEAFFSVATKKT